MSNFTQFIRKAVPIALTIVGSVATVAAVIFAADEGPRYKKALEEKEDMTASEKVTTAVKTFAPAIACATISVACGVGAHMMDMHTQASIMGASMALKEGYKKFVKENGELNGKEANEKIIRKIEEECLPEEVRDEEGEKIYKVYLKNLRSNSFDEIAFEATKEELLQREIKVNMELGSEGRISLNRALELFELGDYKIPSGNDVGWSIEMLIEANSWQDWVPWLLFDYTRNYDGSLTMYPVWPSVEGYDTDYEY